MAATVTLAQLRERSRLYADERPAGTDTYLTNAEVTNLVNQSLKELYDLLLAARGHDYYLSTATITTAASTATYSLPADHYETLKLAIQWSSTDIERIDDAEIEEIDDLRNWSTWGRHSPKGYRVVGGNVVLAPTPTSVVDIEHAYVPAFTELVNDADPFDGVNGWDKLVALQVAIEIRRIQQEDASDLKDSFAEQYERIQTLAADRAARATKQVRDVSPERYMSRWPERLPRP